MRGDQLDPLLSKVNGLRSFNNEVPATLSKEEIQLIRLFKHIEILKNNASKAL